MKKLLFVMLISCIACNISFAQSTQLKAQGMFFTAMEEYEGENYKSSITYLDKAINLLGKTNSKIQYYKVLAYNKLNEDLKCNKEIKTYLNLNPPRDDYYREVLVIYTKNEAKVEAAKQRQLAAKKKRQQQELEAKRLQLKRDAKLFEHKQHFALHKELHDAINNRNKNKIRELIAKGADINLAFDSKANPYNIPNWNKGWYVKVNKHTLPPMYWKIGDMDFMSFIFKYAGLSAANLEWSVRSGGNWLGLMVKQAKWSKQTDERINKTVNILLNHGARPNVRLLKDENYSRTVGPLYWSIKYKLQQTSISLMKSGAVPLKYSPGELNNGKYSKTHYSHYPVFEAIKNEQNTLLEYLNPWQLPKGVVDIYEFDKEYTGSWKDKKLFISPLCYAIMKGNGKAVDILMTKNLDFSKQVYLSRSKKYGNCSSVTAFQLAIICDELVLLKALAIKGVKWDNGGISYFPQIKAKKNYFKDNLKLAKEYGSKELYEFIKGLKNETIDLSSDINYSKAKSFYDSGKYSFAATFFNKVLNKNPKHFETNYWLGHTYYAMKNYLKANQYFSKAVDLSPENYYTNLWYGINNLRLKEYKVAEICFTKATKLKPTEYSAFSNLGQLYLDKGEFEKAISNYKTAYKNAKSNKQKSNAYGNIGWVYYCLGDYNNCISNSLVCLEYDKKTYLASYNIALSKLCQNRIEEAKKLYEKIYIEATQDYTDSAIGDLENLIKSGKHQEVAQEIIDKILNEPVFVIVENMPEFQGGNKELQNFLANNIVYPQEAIAKNITGKVYISFIVGKNGEIRDITIVQSPNELLSQAGIDVVKKMSGKWKPGYQKGKPVKVSYTLPINFSF